MTKKVYLAGPDVFRDDAVQRGEDLKKYLGEYGFQGQYPFDNEVQARDFDNKFEMAWAIYEGNLDMIKECDIVIANLEPFRGPSVDPGTAFEIGMAVALGKKVYGYYPHGGLTEYKDRAIEHGAKNSEYPQVEDFGLCENLMIALGCTSIFDGLEDVLKHMVKTEKFENELDVHGKESVRV